jgi:hypothetical protein
MFSLFNFSSSSKIFLLNYEFTEMFTVLVNYEFTEMFTVLRFSL